MKIKDQQIVKQGLNEGKPATQTPATAPTPEPQAPRPETGTESPESSPEPEPEKPAVKQESEERVLAKAAVRAMMPALLTTLEAVLKCEDLGPQRAYILSDLPGALTGDNMAKFQLSKRIEAAGCKGIMGRITGHIRAEFAKPHYNTLAGVTTPQTEGSESDADDVGL